MPPSFDVRRVLARNTAWNYASVAINVGVNVLLFRYVVSRIGETSAGIWLLLASLTGYLGLLQLGTIPAVTQLMAAHLERREQSLANQLASTTLALLAGLGLAPMILLPAAPMLARLLRIPQDLQAGAGLVFALGLISFAAAMPGQAFNAFLSGAQRQDRCGQAWMLSSALKLCGAIAVLEGGLGLVGLVSMELGLVVLLDLVLGALAFRSIPGLRVSWRLVNGADFRRLVSFGGVLLIAGVCALFIEQSDRIVIGAFLPIAMVTYYAAAWKLYMLAYLAPTALLYALSPVAAALAARSDEESLRRVVMRLTKYSAALAILLVGVLAFSAGALLKLWMGDTFAGHANVARILLISFSVTAFNHAGFAALVGMRRVTTAVWAYSVPQAVLNLLISLVLVKPLGIAGVALGTAIPALALEPVFLAILMRELGLDWRTWWVDVVVPTLRPAVCFVPAAVCAALWQAPTAVSAAALAGAAGYAAVFFTLSLSPAERIDVVDLIRRRSRTPSASGSAVQRETRPS